MANLELMVFEISINNFLVCLLPNHPQKSIHVCIFSQLNDLCINILETNQNLFILLNKFDLNELT